MRKPDQDQRRAFLRKIPFAIASIGVFSFFKFQKSKHYPEIKIKTISKAEADEIIKDHQFTDSRQLNPAPAPASRNIKG